MQYNTVSIISLYITFNQVACCQLPCITIQNCRRRSHINFSHPHVHTIADDLVAQLSELLASATKLIEATTESLEELTERKATEKKDEQKEEVKETKEEEAV